MAVARNRIRYETLGNYETFADFLTAIGTTYTTLVVTRDINLGTSQTYTNTQYVRFEFKNNAKLTGTNCSIAIYSMDESPDWQIFGSGVTPTGLKYVRPEWFGAVGAAGIDDTAEVNKADAVAYACNAPLVFSAKTYYGYGFTPSAKWIGNKTTIKNTYAASYSGGEKYFFAYCTTSGWECDGITFDGSVSADPGTWNATTLKQFTGCIPLFLNNVHDFKIKNCTFINALFAGLRIGNSYNGVIENITVNKCRSDFGDGIYIESSHDIVVDGGYIYDFNRIGVVTEGVPNGTGSYNCRFTNLTIEYGHDGSLMYGEEQYNTGFWFENSASSTIDNCNVYNTTHVGIKVTTGINTNIPYTVSTTNISNCVVRETGYAMHIGSLGGTGGLKSVTNITNCATYDSPLGIVFTGDSPNDVCNVVNTYVSYHQNTQNTASAFNTTGYVAHCDMIMNINNCVVNWEDSGTTRLTNDSLYVADVLAYEAGKCTFNISNLSNVDLDNELFIRATGATYIFNVNTVKNKIYLHGIGGSSFNIFNSNINYLYTAGTRFDAQFCNITGPCIIANDIVRLNNNNFVFGTNPYPAKSDNRLFLAPNSVVSDQYQIVVRANLFSKDVNTNDHLFRYAPAGGGSNHPRLLISDNVFYNNGTSTTTNPFISFAYNTDFSYAIFENNKCDSRVLYPIYFNPTGLFNKLPGLDDTVMHVGDSVTNGKYYSGDIRLTSTTAATTKDTGALTLEGGLGLEGAVVGPKYRTTIEGGFAVLLTNRTGGNSVKGESVCVSSSYDNAVQKIVVDVPDNIGVFYESGVADGSDAWVVIRGIADVYCIGNVTRKQLLRGFVTGDAGYVTGQALAENLPTAPFATDKHFYEIGHALESRTGAGLVKAILHQL